VPRVLAADDRVDARLVARDVARERLRHQPAELFELARVVERLEGAAPARPEVIAARRQRVGARCQDLEHARLAGPALALHDLGSHPRSGQGVAQDQRVTGARACPAALDVEGPYVELKDVSTARFLPAGRS